MSCPDTTPIEKFRQIKNEIRGSKAYLIVGIDVAKDKHYAFFGDANGKTILKRLLFENNAEGFRKLLIHVEEKRLKMKLDKVVFGLEPTANYHKPLSDFLIKEGYQIVLVSNGAVKNNRELLDGRWDKNDMKDAANVADLISQGKCIYYDQNSADIGQIRALLSFRRKLKKLEHGAKVRIRNQLIAKYFPELDRFYSGFETVCLSILEHCFDPQFIALMEINEFQMLVCSRKLTISQSKKLQDIWLLAQSSVGCEVDDAAEFEARLLVNQLRQYRKEVKSVEQQINQICQQTKDYQLLQTIPGFGPLISALVIAAIGDPFRFQNGKQVIKMAGLDLSASRSGSKSLSVSAKISKKGKADLRYGLYQSALVASSKNLNFKCYLADKIKGRCKEPGISTKMRIKLAAKMLIIAWTMMKNKVPFDPSLLQISK